MPGDQQINPDKVLKTGALISFGNLFMSPYYAKLGAFTSLSLTAAALFGLYQVGKSQQPGNSFFGFFSNRNGAGVTDVNTSMKHIAEGGATVFDRIFPPGKK